MMKKCPVCTDTQLNPVLTKQGVEVDVCPKCEGIWLDENEIFHFTKTPTYLHNKFKDAIKDRRATSRKSPVTGTEMVELPMFEGKVDIDFCQDTGGIWLDKGEIEQFPIDKFELAVDKGFKEPEPEPVDQPNVKRPIPELIPLPNLTASSFSVLFGMYAVLTFILITASLLTESLTPGLALILGFVMVGLQFLLGPFFMDISLRWLYRIRWVTQDQLPGHLQDFTARLCTRENIKFPRFGIIQDGSPQAFTYGHHPNNGRIVISQGLMDLLDDEEVEGVVAHEVGHIVHWDMLLMTVAQLVPLILYWVYRTLISMRSSGREDKSAAARYAIAVGAYILYIISEYVVLWFSRIREYYADRYAGQATGKPEKLASALVKIGYGLAGREPAAKSESGKRSGAMKGVEALGIFNSNHANSLAMSTRKSARDMGGDIDKQTLKDVAKWDLWNPWAGYYELHSTHPLIAKRIRMLSNLSMSMGKPPYVQFDERKPESYWDDFIRDVIINIAPTATFIFGGLYCLGSAALGGASADPMTTSAGFSGNGFGIVLGLVGLLSLGKVLYSYPNQDFAPMNVSSLLKKIRVSAMKPVPCKINGTLIGRGVPGLIYSEDFVLQDKTGIIFLDYHQPLMFINFFFGLLRAAKYQNKEAEIVGWYRRAPIPYIEIKEMRVDGKSSSCYTYHMKIFFAIALILGGICLLFI